MAKIKEDIEWLKLTPQRVIDFINYHSNISPDDLFDLLEYLHDATMLTPAGDDLKHDLWKIFIKKPKDWHKKEIKKSKNITKKRLGKKKN